MQKTRFIYPIALLLSLNCSASLAAEKISSSPDSCVSAGFVNCPKINQGIKAYNQKNYPQAINIWLKLKPNTPGVSRRNLARPNELSTIDNYLALSYLKSNQLEKAKTTADQAISLYPTPALYNTQGNIALKLQNNQQAAQSYQAAIELYQQQNDPQGVYGAKLNKAVSLHRLGQFRQSKYLLEDLKSNLTESNPELNTQLYQSLGITYGIIGEYDQAEEALKKSLSLTNDQELQASIYLDLGNIYASEDPVKSLDYYQQIQNLDNNNQLEILSLINQINPLIKLGDYKNAIKALNQAEANIGNNQDPQLQLALIDKQIKLSQITKTSLINPGSVQSLKRITQAELPNQVIAAYGNLAKIAQFNGNSELAIKSATKARNIAIEANAPHLAYKWEHVLGKSLAHQGLKDEAISQYQNAIAHIQEVRGDLVGYNPDIQYDFRDDIEPIYRELVGLLVENPHQANLVSARNTLENLQLAELENYFRSACLQSTPQQIDSLNEKTATIYPILLPDKLATITNIPGEGLQYSETAINPNDVENTVEEFILNSAPTRSSKIRRQKGAKIYDWLISANLEKYQQQEVETLIFVLDSGMRNIPLAAINNHQGKYLIEDFEVAIAPGLQLLSSRPLNTGKVQAIVGGISEANQGFTPLPGVAQEIAQIESTVAAKTVLNEKFTNQAIKDRLAGTEDAPILHFATHGKFSSDPNETFILSWNDKINVNEIENLLKVREETPKVLPIELLLLSACETATGDDRAALGLAGVAVKSGARSTIGTLWSVNDESTSQIVSQIYEGINQKNLTSKAEILRQAQLSMLDSKYSHPYYWAGFTLVGNPL